jgi:hypothetical protein
LGKFLNEEGWLTGAVAEQLVSTISGILVVGLPSAVDAVMILLSLLLLASLHAVAGFTVFASIPAFHGVHTV